MIEYIDPKHFSLIINLNKIARASKLAVNILIGFSENKGANFGAQEYKDYGYQVQCNVIEVQFVDEVSFNALRVCMFWYEATFPHLLTRVLFINST